MSSSYDHNFSVFSLVRVLDPLLISFCSWLSYYFYLGTFSWGREYSVALLITFFLTLFIFPTQGAYKPVRGRSSRQYIGSVTRSWFILLLSLVALSALLKVTSTFSRGWFLYWTFLTWGVLILSRVLMIELLNSLRRRGYNLKRVAIFGAGVLGEKLYEQTVLNKDFGYDVCFFLDDYPEKTQGNLKNKKVIKAASDLADQLKSEGIHELWIALPLRAESRVKDILHTLRHSFIQVRFIPDIFSFHLFNCAISDVGGIPTIDLNTTKISGVNTLIKALEDYFLGTIILFLISPLLFVLALLVKLTSKGPVFYKQLRHGFDGKPINIYKFRSMYVHDEDKNNIVQASKSDSRITPVGRFLRKTSLDELPQFINVLQGKMSIVGPRPHALSHNEFYKDQIEHYMQRHKVKPGITGWAQVNGWRGETDTLEKMQKRVEHDIYYLQNWSLWFDLKIIFLTVFKGFVGKNAY